jgi:aryl-alcohol dehydrogenase-like predicted oxidoreductase
MAQVALAWVLSKDGGLVVQLLEVAHPKMSVVTAPIVGTSSVEKLNDTISMSCSVLFPLFSVAKF